MNMKLIGLLIFSIALVTLVTSVSAQQETLGTFKQYECVRLIQTCSNCTYNNISTVTYPNSSIAASNIAMTKNGLEYNATFCATDLNGEYIVNGYGDPDGTNTIWAYTFTINPQGIESTSSRTESVTRAIYFMFGISIILFIGFLFTKDKLPVKWTLFIISIIFFLIALNLIMIGIKDEVVNPRVENFLDGFTAISFYFYWFAAGMLIFLWFFTFINTWLYKKNMEKMRRFGEV